MDQDILSLTLLVFNFTNDYQERNMRNTAKTIARYLSIESEKGVTAIEYGLLASVISLAIIVAATLVGTNLNTVFGSIATKLA
jgi:pilus assembly protein Flp/PilA